MRRLVCDGVLSSCHHQLDVSVPKRAMQCGKYVVQHPNVAFDVDAHTLFDEARRENDAGHHRGVHHSAWVALVVLVDAHVRIGICLSCRSLLGSNHPNLVVQCNSSGRISRQNTTRVRSKGLKCRVPPSAHPRAAVRHGKSSVLKAVFSRQSRCKDGLEAPRLQIFV